MDGTGCADERRGVWTFYENYIVGELTRNYAYGKDNVNINFYRDKGQKEIDLVIEKDNVLHPLEIKKGTAPDKRVVKAFDVLAGAKKKSERRYCLYGRVTLPDRRENCFIPSNII